LTSRERERSPDGAPELICYLAMAVRAAPCLERAIRFTASQLGGEIGEFLRRKLSELDLGRKKSGAEVLKEMEEEWEKNCPELGRCLRLISSSTCERSEHSRERSLNMSLSTVLHVAVERGKEYASRIHQQVLLLYTLGVLLPLVVSVMIPVFSTAGFGGVRIIVVFNCIICPALVWWFGVRTLRGRPFVFEDVKIQLSPVTPVHVAAALCISSAPVLLVLVLGIEQEWLPLAFLWSSTIFFSALLYWISLHPYRLWQSGMRMEEELPRTLVLIGNRMIEGRPAEEAMSRAAESCGNNELRALLVRAVSRVRFGGVSLRKALFGNEGLLHAVPSSMIIGAMRAMVDLVELGTRAGGEALLYISEVVGKLQEARFEMRRIMGEVVGSMRSVAIFFAPMIAGVTASIFYALSEAEGLEFFGWMSIPSNVLTFAMGFYAVLLSVILMWIATEIEFGNHLPLRLMAIAISAPVAILIFTVSLFLGGQFMGKLIG